MMRFLLFVLLLLAAGAAALAWGYTAFEAPGPASKNGPETVVLIPLGTGTHRIAQILSDAGTVSNPLVFEAGARLYGKTALLHAGEFAIPSQASMSDIVAILVLGHSIQHKLTAAEGLTSQMIVDLIKADPVLVGDVGPTPDEGTLLPETYLFTRGTTRAEIVARMRKADDEVLSRLWASRAQGLPFTTPREAVILASIVEKESAIPSERRHVASVFVNRLRLKMRLQSDPTIIYGLTKGYPLGHGIRQSELTGVTPYNTYAIDGLPPTPICNPGKDSIAAVLNPAVTKDLYFVADGNGGHVFAPNAALQNANVAQWRKLEKLKSQIVPLSTPDLRR